MRLTISKMARHSRFKTHREEASKGHLLLGELLQQMFPICKIYQEYALDLILKRGYKDQQVEKEFQDQYLLKRAKSLRVDWVVLDRRLVFEFLGEHHYRPIDYGTGSGEEDYQHRLFLDVIKRRIVKEADFRLIEWPYYEPLTAESLVAKIEV
jgi:hypothetical protein